MLLFIQFYSEFLAQGLSGDIEQRQELLNELHTTAQPLIDSCDHKVVAAVQQAVKAAETEWNDTNDKLRDLCTKYKRAVQLWQQYREASDAVKHWADEQMGTIGTLQPLDAQQVNVSIKSQFQFCSNVASAIERR